MSHGSDRGSWRKDSNLKEMYGKINILVCYHHLSLLFFMCIHGNFPVYNFILGKSVTKKVASPWLTVTASVTQPILHASPVDLLIL